MTNLLKHTAAYMGLSLLTATFASAATVTVDTNTAGSTDGAVIYTSSGQTGTTSSSYTTSYSGNSGKGIGVSGSTGARTVSDFVMAFRLPTMPTDATISSATLTVTLSSATGAPAFNADLWGLGYRTGTAGTSILAGTATGGVSTSSGDLNDADGDNNPTAAGTAIVQFSDTTDLGAASGTGILARTKLADNVFTSASASGTTVTIPVTAYLQALYAAGAASSAGTTTGFSGGLAILRLSPDANINLAVGSLMRYDMLTNNDGGTTVPTLNLTFDTTAAPEPAALSVLGIAGLLAGRRRRA